MSCREAKRRLGLEGRGAMSPDDRQALGRHLEVCARCGEAAKVARLSSALLGALREEIAPGPTFYARLRERIAEAVASQTETTLLQVLGLARRLLPAMAFGVLLLAGASISLTGPRFSQAPPGREIFAFSLEELSMPAAVERPSQDQMMAFVLMRGSESDGRDAR